MTVEYLQDLVDVFVPRTGRPPVDESFRLRDRYAAHWIMSTLTGSAGLLERELSGRDFPRRKDGVGGFNQPHALARAARGKGMIPLSLVSRARERLPRFGSVYDNTVWDVLSLPAALAASTRHPRAIFDSRWIRISGLSRGSLSRCWNEDGSIESFSTALIARASSINELSALALLVEACRHSVQLHDRAMARVYCEDFLERLRSPSVEPDRRSISADWLALRQIVEPLAALIHRRSGFIQVQDGALVLRPSLPAMRIRW